SSRKPQSGYPGPIYPINLRLSQSCNMDPGSLPAQGPGPAGMTAALQRKPAVGEMDLPRRVARLVRCQIHRERRDLLRRAEPPHRLAVDEILPHRLLRPAGFLCARCDAAVEGRRLDRARADR